jgi:hypothetical protein
MNKYSLLILVGFLLISSTNIQSQDTLKATPMKWGTELNFNPFSGNLSFNNANGQIKLRKFLTGNKALRLALTMDFKQDNSSQDNLYGTSPVHNASRKSSFTIQASFGQENHFAGNRRLSPYIGWEAAIGYKTSKNVINTTNNRVTIDGAWQYSQSYSSGGYTYIVTNYEERGFWSIGGNLVAGFDFYMAKNFYLGYEVLFGADYIKYSKIDITQSIGSAATYPSQDDESWKLGPRLINGIRIGFIF